MTPPPAAVFAEPTAAQVPTMPEPTQDRALIGLFDPDGEAVPLMFERLGGPDDEDTAGDHWWGVEDGEAYRYVDVCTIAVRDGLEVVRLYRADDPSIVVLPGDER